jgi:hypothetical protein
MNAPPRFSNRPHGRSDQQSDELTCWEMGQDRLSRTLWQVFSRTEPDLAEMKRLAAVG